MKRILLLGLLTITGCADPHMPLSADFGDSVNANIALQTVNPAPTTEGLWDTDGQRAGNAFNRYRTNRVYQPHLPLESGKLHAPPPVDPTPAVQ